MELWGRNCFWRALKLARKRFLYCSGPAGREKASPLLFCPSTTSFCPGSVPTRSCVRPPYSPNYPANSRCQTFWYIPPFPASPGLLPSSYIYPCISVSLKVWLPLSCTEIFSMKCKLKGRLLYSASIGNWLKPTSPYGLQLPRRFLHVRDLMCWCIHSKFKLTLNYESQWHIGCFLSRLQVFPVLIWLWDAQNSAFLYAFTVSVWQPPDWELSLVSPTGFSWESWQGWTSALL